MGMESHLKIEEAKRKAVIDVLAKEHIDTVFSSSELKPILTKIKDYY